MADNSKIEWTDASWNPIVGTKGRWHCTKVSPGCKYCYAERLNRRFHGPAYIVGADTLQLDEKKLQIPLHWRRPRMVFVCSMTDLFHEDVPAEWIERIFQVMADAEQHTFQVLTKRIERALNWLDEACWPCSGCPISELPPNIWFGVSAENQHRADERIPKLLEIPAKVRFVSCEPLLGRIDLTKWLRMECGHPCDEYLDYGFCQCTDMGGYQMIHWVITGGESGRGNNWRPAVPGWFRSIRDQCQAKGVAFFHKQHGGSTKDEKHDAWGGRELDGRTWDEFPINRNIAVTRGE